MNISISRKQAMNIIPLGWHKLVTEFYDNLDMWNYDYNDNIVVTDIKRKWGDLRITFFPNNEYLFEISNNIRKKSNSICEICGEIGKHTDMYYNTEHWIYVLCCHHNKIHPIDYFEKENY